MKAEKQSEEQIIGAFAGAGRRCQGQGRLRAAGHQQVTFCRSKEKPSGLQVGDAKWLRQLEEESRRLKHVIAYQVLDLQALNAGGRRRW